MQLIESKGFDPTITKIDNHSDAYVLFGINYWEEGIKMPSEELINKRFRLISLLTHPDLCSKFKKLACRRSAETFQKCAAYARDQAVIEANPPEEDEDGSPEEEILGDWVACQKRYRKKRATSNKFTGCSPVNQVVDKNATASDQPTTDEAKAKVVTDTWQKVFDGTTLQDEDLHLMHNWLAKLRYGIAPQARGNINWRKWLPSKSQIRKAVRESGNSAAGPDGIPFVAYRSVTELATEVFHDFLVSILHPDAADATIPKNFNEAWLVLLSKGNFFQGDGFTGYAPDELRPLSIVNRYNRILANCLRLTVATWCEKLVGLHQRGFIKDRYMSSNIFEIDMANLAVSYKCRKGACLLFDFKAAFPSISHTYIWACLAAWGMPSCVIRCLQCFYHNNKHRIKVGSNIFDSVFVHSGVRQGCPSSPLIFVLCIEPFLQHLSGELPSLVILRASADDIGLQYPRGLG